MSLRVSTAVLLGIGVGESVGVSVVGGDVVGDTLGVLVVGDVGELVANPQISHMV